MSVTVVVGALKVVFLILLFSFVHFILHVLDLTVVRLIRLLAAQCTKLFGWPRPGAIASARPPSRTSQKEKAVVLHVQSRTLANSWFGWPLVLQDADETTVDGRSGPAALFRLSAPAYTNHVSTILANFKPVADIHYKREIVHSFDGCDIAVDWAYPENNCHLFGGTVESVLEALAGIGKATGRIDTTFARFGLPPRKDVCDPAVAEQHTGVMSIVPGLLSESSTTYIRSFVRVALSHGFAVAVVHTRGLGTKLTRPKMFHGGMTDDLRFWVYNHLSQQALKRRFGRPTHAVVVGFSLGANVLAKFLAEDGDKVAAHSAVIACSAVSAPWRFHDVQGPMSRWVQKMTYDSEFKGGLKQYLITNESALRDPKSGKGVNFDFDKGVNVADVPEFDKYVVAPHHGFRDADHYYTAASCFPLLHQVTMPLCCIGVADDPICGAPPSGAEWNDVCRKTAAVCYAELPSGGHLGCLGHPMEELTRQPTPIEALVCRSMAHYVRRYGEGLSSPNAPRAATAFPGAAPSDKHQPSKPAKKRR